MFTSVANTVRRFASEVDLSLMRGKHEEIISDHLSGGQTWLKGKVQASCQDVTSLLTTMTNKGQALTNEIDMSSMITPLITLLILLSWVWSAQAAICFAPSVSMFNDCKASVNPGDEIVFPNGTYSGFDKNIIAIEGQPEKPITIRGATSAGAVFNGNDNEFIVTGRHLVLKWLKFTNRSTNDAGVEAVLTLKGAQFTRLTEITCDNVTGEHCIQTGRLGSTRDATDNEIDHSLFQNITSANKIIAVSTDAGPNGHSNRLYVHDNNFLNIENTTDGESPFEIGNNQSGATIHTGIVFEDNVFQNVSTKSGTFHTKASGVTYRRNRFINTSHIVFRQGFDSVFDSNYFECGSIPTSLGVLRLHGGRHQVTNNIFNCNNTSKVIIRCPFGTGDTIQHYTTCHDVDITNNVFYIANDFLMNIGQHKGSRSNDGPRLDPPHDIRVRNNVFRSTSGVLLQVHADATAITIENNHYHATGGATNGRLGTASSTGDPLFVHVASKDFNPDNGSPLIGTASDGRNKGVHQDITFDSAEIVGGRLVTTYHVSSGVPLVNCTPASFDIRHAGVNQTISGCTPGAPQPHTVTTTMAAALAAGVAVTIEGSYGAVQANRRIGNLYNDKIRAFTTRLVRNPASPGWTTGLTTSVQAGSDRVLAIGCCWRKLPTTLPMSLSNFTYGGQACTVINSIDEPDNQSTATIYGVTAHCPETSIVNATDNIIRFTVSEDPTPTRPVICASKFFAGINQASPVQDSAVRATASGASVATPALTTTNPGVAFVLGCAVENGVYSPDAGWTLHVDAPEDADPSTRLLIADRTTDGTTVTPSATFDSDQADDATQIVAVGVSFNGEGR